ncbi:MAG: hypothetical protein J6W75_00765 [Bacteroidaceae bacterium]|nr:hypothetical protein [Bacteroidaceae bacterium]
MKKIFLILACLAGITTGAMALSTDVILVHHQGTVTTHTGTNLYALINSDNVENGDTLFLCEGTFTCYGPIIKMVTIRGTGEKTIIKPSSNTSTYNPNGILQLQSKYDTGYNSMDFKAPFLESLTIDGSLNFSPNYSDIRNLTIRACKFKSLSVNWDYYSLVNFQIDRCQITEELKLGRQISSLIVNNSKIETLSAENNSSANINLVNCNIHSIGSPYFRGGLINCIVDTLAENANANPAFSQCVLINTLVNASNLNIDQESTTVEHCYVETLDGELLDGETQECTLSTEELLSRGYVGNDGTVVGIYGSTTAFTLRPGVPSVASSTVTLDPDKRLLNVKMTLTAK